MFTSGAEHSDYTIMLVRTDPEAPKRKGVSMFMVPLKVQGVTIQKVKTFQDERTNITYYGGVVVPDAYRLGEVNGGLAVMSLALEIEQGMSFGPYQERLVYAAERLCARARSPKSRWACRGRASSGGGIVPPIICAPDMDKPGGRKVNGANRQQERPG